MTDTSIDLPVLIAAIAILLLIGFGYGREVGIFFAILIPAIFAAWWWTA